MAIKRNKEKKFKVHEGDTIVLKDSWLVGWYERKGFTIIYEDDNEYTMWKQLDLRPQSTWKPSDEQVDAVKEAACYSSVFSKRTIDNLISLSKQLKKLMEE